MLFIQLQNNNMNKYTKFNTFFVIFIALLTFGLYGQKTNAAVTATLSLSPTSSTVVTNQTFTVNIVLNTAGNATDGVDVFSLRFNPSVLQVVDQDAGIAGVQITPGTLMGTTANTADNTAGTIQFSQASGGGTNYTGSGVLATITFRAVGVGTSNVTMDFTLGNTADSNVAFQGTDLLASVTNGSYTVVTPFDFTVGNGGAKSVTQGSSVTQTVSATLVGGTAAPVTFSASGLPTGATASFSPTSCTPTCSTPVMTITTTGSTPTGNSTITVTGTSGATSRTSTFVLTVNAVPFDFNVTTGAGKSVTQGSSVTQTVSTSVVAGAGTVTFGVSSALPTGVTASFLPASCTAPCSSTMTISTTGSTPVGTSNVVVTGTSGATTKSAPAFTLTVNLLTYARTIQLDPEGRSNKALSNVSVEVYNPSKSLIKTYTVTTNSTGQGSITFDIPLQVVYLRVQPTTFLSRVISLDLNTATTYVFSKLLAGDLVRDNLINAVDYSNLNTNWFTTDATSDINKDGLVNSIDFSFMNQNWAGVGEEV